MTKTIFILHREDAIEYHNHPEFICYWFIKPTAVQIQAAILNRGIEIPYSKANDILNQADNDTETVFLSGSYWIAETLPA